MKGICATRGSTCYHLGITHGESQVTELKGPKLPENSGETTKERGGAKMSSSVICGTYLWQSFQVKCLLSELKVAEAFLILCFIPFFNRLHFIFVCWEIQFENKTIKTHQIINVF